MFPGGASVKVKHLISAPTITVNADTPLREIIHLLSPDLSGVPVVDAGGNVTGSIRGRELFPTAKTITRPEMRKPVLFQEIIDPNYTVDRYKESAPLTAKDIMTNSRVVDVDDLIAEVIWKLVPDHLYMVPVLEGDTVVGIVTRRKFIQFLAQEL